MALINSTSRYYVINLLVVSKMSMFTRGFHITIIHIQKCGQTREATGARAPLLQIARGREAISTSTLIFPEQPAQAKTCRASRISLGTAPKQCMQHVYT